jgi:hypothetical protein
MMKTGRTVLSVVALVALLPGLGCRVRVDKSENGQEKNVKVDTPLGGVHVRKDDTAAADMGVPVYPGAQVATDNDGNKSVDVHMGFGQWQLRVKVVSYRTPDASDKVVAFYQKALGRFGDVIQCKGNTAVGTPTVTREGLTCNDDGAKEHMHINESSDGQTNLKAGSKRHQHIMAIEKDSGGDGTKFTLVELQLPQGSDEDKESN